MKKVVIIFLGILFCLLTVTYSETIYYKVLDIYDRFMDFTHPRYPGVLGYYEQLEKLYESKSSDYLLNQIKKTENPIRFRYSAIILLDRGDKREIDPLITILNNDYKNYEIRQTAILVLTKFGEEKTINEVMNVVNKYKNVKFNLRNKADYNKYNLYRTALRNLSAIEYEPLYPFLMQMAQKGDKREKTLALGCLYMYKRHWKEVLPLYIEKLRNDKIKGFAIDALRHLGRPEAIPALEEVVKSDSVFSKEAEEAIIYLKSLKYGEGE